MAQPGTLRSRLKEADIVLYQHLERSWQIALDWWLYAVPVESGSSNSAPHLRNVERHLDETIKAFEDSPGTLYTDRLAPAEIYILLSAVLFHDIGRTQSKNGRSHGELADEFLRKKYANLGIPSVELAEALGRISVFHSPPEGKTHTSLLGSMLTTSIEPYGRIREPFIAALLLLADSMDASYTRALPPFLAEPDDLPAVGRFRRRIRGVYVDPVACMVRTVLVPDDGMPTIPATLPSPDKYIIELNEAHKALWDAFDAGVFAEHAKWIKSKKSEDFDPCLIDDLKKKLEKINIDKIKGVPYRRLLRIWKQRLGSGLPAGSLLGELSLCEPDKTINLLLSLGMIKINRFTAGDNGAREKAAIPFPKHADLAIAIGDMMGNSLKLDQIKSVLAAEGIVLDSWALERSPRLYNAEGESTYEPILTGDFLERVLAGMWSLSASVFASSRFSYVDLAAHVGEPNVARVQFAARRIAITAGMRQDGQFCIEAAALPGNGA